MDNVHGTDVVTSSGRHQTIRTPDKPPSNDEQLVICNPHKFIMNMKRAWEICEKMKKNDADNQTIGIVFYHELEALFKRYS